MLNSSLNRLHIWGRVLGQAKHQRRSSRPQHHSALHHLLTKSFLLLVRGGDPPSLIQVTGKPEFTRSKRALPRKPPLLTSMYSRLTIQVVIGSRPLQSSTPTATAQSRRRRRRGRRRTSDCRTRTRGDRKGGGGALRPPRSAHIPTT